MSTTQTKQFLELLYSRYNYRGVGSLFDKAKEVLLSLVDDEPILDLATLELDTTFSSISSKDASVILANLTKQKIQDFLKTKEGYQRQLRPPKKIFRWLTTTNRLIKWQIDLIGIKWLGLEYQYAITIIDVFSKYAFFLPIVNKEGFTIAKKLDILFSLPPLERILSKPKLLLSDNGSEFNNDLVRKVCKFHEVFQIFGLPYHPLGIIERFNQTIKRKIRASTQESTFPQDRKGALETFRKLLMEYNTSKHSTIGYPPMFVHFSQDQKIIDNVRSKIESILQRNKMRSEADYQVGDQVRILVWDDPSKSPKEQHEIRQKFMWKKFPGAYWTKEHFKIEKILRGPQFTQFVLKNYPARFKTDQIQKVFF
jgi:transposase InsO family protein